MSQRLHTNSTGSQPSHKPHARDVFRHIIDTYALRFMFYSAPHSVWMKLDYWFFSVNEYRCISEDVVIPWTLSDHSHILLQLQIPYGCVLKCYRRFHSAALPDPVFCSEVLESVIEYFALNIIMVSTQATLWGALKVLIRGVCISQHPGILCDICAQLLCIQLDLWDIDCAASTSGDPWLQHRSILLMEIHDLTDRELADLGKNARALCYWEGEHPDRNLARLLHPS
ncbi:hypothetical protein NDU88_009486 [Pleurodeles waltl]|uniref:Uncharacterized protein n=1 Tax=Pleurodeles waltl TaxID=8319 RepID=A0AAV7RZU8_PLEWA|nr:hypothetical protein NDU88_009486 [Pleurodeles waltl]